ncbi:MAG TPA: HNH endonuclease signature motif containing protein, partial [Anaeromyxobacteraceae bacterium]
QRRCRSRRARPRSSSPEVELAGAAATGDAPGAVAVPFAPPRAENRPTVRPVAADTYSLRVTIDAALKHDIDQLTELLSHKVPNGDLAAVLRVAVRCAIERHGKRNGAVEPAHERTRKSPADRPTAIGKPAKVRAPIAAEVRRQVWRRDEGSCAWIGADGRRCGSKWRLELDHIHPAALGGPSTVENIRLLCNAHNNLHAEQTFGRAHMAQFRRKPQSGRFTFASGSRDAGASE